MLVGLYADHDPPKLLTFLQTSSFISLPQTLELCRKRNFVKETIYLLGKWLVVMTMTTSVMVMMITVVISLVEQLAVRLEPLVKSYVDGDDDDDFGSDDDDFLQIEWATAERP